MNHISSYVTHDEVRLARKAPLYEFLVSRHGGQFKKCGSSLYMTEQDSIYIKQGCPGFNDFSSGRHGNPIDFLTRHLGYSFVDAVKSLNEFCEGHSMETSSGIHSGHDDIKCINSSEIQIPAIATKPFRNMYAYLMRRGIPVWVIRSLESQGLIYQEAKTNNIVFLSREKDYCELRGTYTYSMNQYHGCRKIGADRFWYMSESGQRQPNVAYVCEAAIDAISLFLIHRKDGKSKDSLYVSIGGVANQKAILRIKSLLPTILAVDNDQAGNDCRRRNPDVPFIIPINKDWNEDLLELLHT